MFLSHFPLCLVFIIPLTPRRFALLSSASFALCLRFLAAFPAVEPQPRPSGRGVPDGLAGGRFRTDPSAADPVLPQTPGGPGGNTYLKQDERQRTGEGPGAGGELRNSRTCHLLHLLLKQSEAVSFKVPALQSCLKHKHTHFAITQVLCNEKKKLAWIVEGGSRGRKKQTYRITDRNVRENSRQWGRESGKEESAYFVLLAALKIKWSTNLTQLFISAPSFMYLARQCQKRPWKGRLRVAVVVYSQDYLKPTNNQQPWASWAERTWWTLCPWTSLHSSRSSSKWTPTQTSSTSTRWRRMTTPRSQFNSPDLSVSRTAWEGLDDCGNMRGCSHSTLQPVCHWQS